MLHFVRRMATTCTNAISASFHRRAKLLCKEGRVKEAVNMLHNINVNVDSSTYIYLLQCCIQKKAFHQGKRLHALILNRNERRLEEDIFLHNTLLVMYSKCGCLADARSVFEGMLERDEFSWNVMIAAYKKKGFPEEAFALFAKMQENGNGVQPDEFTFASVVAACASSACVEEGVDIHRKIIRSGFYSDVVVVNTLIDMYAKFEKMHKARVLFDKMQHRDTISWTAMISGYAQNGLLDEAEKLFNIMPQKDTIPWNAMITGYAQNGLNEGALKLFDEMQRNGVEPSEFTFASVIPACANSASLEEGVDIHRKIIRNGFHCDVFVVNALVDMYAKFGNIHKASVLFDKMKQRDTISWNAMISGFSQNGNSLEALKHFQSMQLTGLSPDITTFASILPVCATFAALEEIHGKIVRNGFLSDIIVLNALIDMYAKGGSIRKARVLFDKMHYRDLSSWNTMIAGYAMHGCGEEAIKLFEQMEHLGVSPDHVTLVGVLSACSHAGLVGEGYQYFNSMSECYHITPAMKHYVCMVDLLGRAGRLDEAKDFINNMPIKPDALVWTCLLGACRIHNNLKLAEFVAEQLLDLDSHNAVPYVLLSNIYAMFGKWNEIENVRKMMKAKSIQKLPGCSWIEVNKEVHTFIVGDRSQPKTQEIYAELERLSRVMKAAGHFPDTRFVLQDVKEEEKEQILCHHSEKLAIAFGVLNTPPGTTIRVVKNLRACGDCHSATKFVSKIVAREITPKDVSRYHHFRDGQCSCGDQQNGVYFWNGMKVPYHIFWQNGLGTRDLLAVLQTRISYLCCRFGSCF